MSKLTLRQLIEETNVFEARGSTLHRRADADLGSLLDRTVKAAPRNKLMVLRASYRPLTGAPTAPGRDEYRVSVVLSGAACGGTGRRVQDKFGNWHRLAGEASARGNARVRCDCRDDFWRFHRARWDAGAVAGPVQERHVAGWRRPVRNPGSWRGICKHALDLIYWARDAGYLDASTLPLKNFEEEQAAAQARWDARRAAGADMTALPKIGRMREPEY